MKMWSNGAPSLWVSRRAGKLRADGSPLFAPPTDHKMISEQCI